MSLPDPSSPQPCVVLRFNHFDPLWRRCWDRSFVDRGLRYVSYRDIETAWIDDAIGSTQDGVSCFMIEAAWVLRHYLEHRPEHLQTVQELARQGRFELLAAGENIIDTNMVHGELLVRNFLLGLTWAEKTIGIRPTTGWLSDDFGSSAQMPQIFRQCGIRWVPAISYKVPDAPYWRGVDGSTVFYEVKRKLTFRLGASASMYRKHPPCLQCRGSGCDACSGRGFDAGPRAEFREPLSPVKGADVVAVMLWGEEILPGLHVAEDIAAFNARQDRIVARQGTYRDLEQYIDHELAQVDSPPSDKISSSVENNPCLSGCYVTRIKLKQRHRAVEGSLLTAEILDTTLRSGALAGVIRNCWRDLTLGAFHDSITSTHIDPAYDELNDLYSRVNNIANDVTAAAVASVIQPAKHVVAVFNPQSFEVTAPFQIALPDGWDNASVVDDAGHSVPVYDVVDQNGKKSATFCAKAVPPLAFANYVLAPKDVSKRVLTERQLGWNDFTIDIGERGITNIAHSELGVIADSNAFLVGELVLEADSGDPWATRSLDRTRERLSPYTSLQSVTAENDDISIAFRGKHPSTDQPNTCDDPLVTMLEWRQTFHLRRGLPWIEVNTHVQWYTHSKRLRIMFPTSTTANDGVYDVPYATIERPRYDGKTNHACSAGGDWPALNWAGVSAENHTIAVFNQGTPSYRVEDGVITTSVLRSPQLPYVLYEPQWYAVRNFSGMMDHGEHHFRHAIYVAKGSWAQSDIHRQAISFNGGRSVFDGRVSQPSARWGLKAKHAHITAIKPAEDGNGIIVRIVAATGVSETATLIVPSQYHTAHRSNLLEETEEELDRTADGYELTVAPWSINTVRIQ